MTLLILLKIAGICFLVLLAFLFLAVLLFLAVPFRYEISERSVGKALEGKLILSWLWQGIRLCLEAKPEDSVKGEFKLFGYRYLRIYYRFVKTDKDEENTLHAVSEEASLPFEEQARQEEENPVQAFNCLFDDSQDTECEYLAEDDGGNGTDPGKTEGNEMGSEKEVLSETGEKQDSDRIREHFMKKRREKKDRLEVFLQKCLDLIKGGFGKICARLKEDLDKLKNSSVGLTGKLKELWILLSSPENCSSLNLFKDQVLRILKELLPRSGSGCIQYGTGDPFQTGQILEVLALFYPVYGKTFEIVPYFEEKKLDTDITVSGRICLGVILICVIRTLFDKGMRRIVQETRTIIREA